MYKQDPRFITAKFASVCPETGKQINKGDQIVYYPRSKSAYHIDSNAADELRGMQFNDAFNMPDANY